MGKNWALIGSNTKLFETEMTFATKAISVF